MNETLRSFLGHLDELRSRLLKSVIAVAIGAAFVYHFGDAIIMVLSKPVGKLVVIDPGEAFITYIKIALWGGFFVASPVCLYQIWRFIGAGLHTSERRVVYAYLPASLVLFIFGAGFGVYIIMNFGMHFLLSFGSGLLTPMISVSRYISFIAAMAVAFGVVFQLPLAMLLLTNMGMLSPAAFIRKRKLAIVLIFIAAGALTPGPDIISQMAMGVPLLILYEAGIMLSKAAQRRKDLSMLKSVKAAEGPSI